MAQERRIVPDNSVLVPAFFLENIEYLGSPFDLTGRAQPIAAAIRTHSVTTFAPELLRIEFMKAAFSKTFPRDGGNSIPIEKVSRQIDYFRDLPISYVSVENFEQDAWDLSVNHRIPPPDSWYLACAMYYDAELWISQDHRDHFAENARAVYANVHVLTREKFNS
jgi:predicted nucleic acid-binding protein